MAFPWEVKGKSKRKTFPCRLWNPVLDTLSCRARMCWNHAPLQSSTRSRALRGSCLDLSFGLGDTGSQSLAGAHGLAIQVYKAARRNKALWRAGNPRK